MLAAHLGPAGGLSAVLLSPSLVAHAHTLRALAVATAAAVRAGAREGTAVSSGEVAGALADAGSGITGSLQLSVTLLGAKLACAITATISGVALAAGRSAVAVVGTVIAVAGANDAQVIAAVETVESWQAHARASLEIAHSATGAGVGALLLVAGLAAVAFRASAGAIVADAVVIAVGESVARNLHARGASKAELADALGIVAHATTVAVVEEAAALS